MQCPTLCASIRMPLEENLTKVRKKDPLQSERSSVKTATPIDSVSCSVVYLMQSSTLSTGIKIPLEENLTKVRKKDPLQSERDDAKIAKLTSNIPCSVVYLMQSPTLCANIEMLLEGKLTKVKKKNASFQNVSSTNHLITKPFIDTYWSEEKCPLSELFCATDTDGNDSHMHMFSLQLLDMCTTNDSTFLRKKGQDERLGTYFEPIF